jgi:hypothetical protein
MHLFSVAVIGTLAASLAVNARSPGSGTGFGTLVLSGAASVTFPAFASGGGPGNSGAHGPAPAEID